MTERKFSKHWNSFSNILPRLGTSPDVVKMYRNNDLNPYMSLQKINKVISYIFETMEDIAETLEAHGVQIYISIVLLSISLVCIVLWFVLFYLPPYTFANEAKEQLQYDQELLNSAPNQLEFVLADIFSSQFMVQIKLLWQGQLDKVKNSLSSIC